MAERVVSVQGAELPRIGLGTWQIDGRECREAVRDALEIGYRHIDTARAYGNEREVGQGLADSGVDRGEVWVTTKVWRDDLRADAVRREQEASLSDLGTDYVDLLLIHWPNPAIPLEETLGAMCELRDEGGVRHVGVSNFPRDLMEEALGIAPIVANQVEYHPRLDQRPLLELAEERDVAIVAYSPFAHGGLLDDPTLAEIGAAHGKTAGQVALRWLIEQPNVAAVPKAASHENRIANLDVFDFELTDDDRRRLDAMAGDDRAIDPGFAPKWD